MSFAARAKRAAGTTSPIPTIASAGTIYLDGSMETALISGSATITLITEGGIFPGRTMTFIGATGAAAVFTNTDDTTTRGQMDLGGGDKTIGAQDILTLKQETNGSWVMVLTTNN